MCWRATERGEGGGKWERIGVCVFSKSFTLPSLTDAGICAHTLVKTSKRS